MEVEEIFAELREAAKPVDEVFVDLAQIEKSDFFEPKEDFDPDVHTRLGGLPDSFIRALTLAVRYSKEMGKIDNELEHAGGRTDEDKLFREKMQWKDKKDLVLDFLEIGINHKYGTWRKPTPLIVGDYIVVESEQPGQSIVDQLREKGNPRETLPAILDLLSGPVMG